MADQVATFVHARLLAPFHYHGLYVPDGTSTDASVLTDTTCMFALAAAMGLVMRPRPKPDYARDIRVLPWKSSLFLGRPDNRVGPPLRRSIDVEREGGYQESLQKGMNSGNVKKTWMIHETMAGAEYDGMVFGPDPFKIAATSEILIRVGVGRTGLVSLIRGREVEDVRLNAATASLFGQRLDEDYRILATIRVSRPLSPTAAVEIMRRWT